MRWSFLLTLFLAAAFGSAWAQTGRWDDSFDFSRVRLVASEEALDGGDTVQLGLEFDVAPGWNIYWRSPGAVGLPPSLTWDEASNIADSQIHWPVPERYTYKFPGEDVGIESMIYRGNTILPLTVTVSDPTQPLFARAQVEYMVCQDQCIFAEATVGIDLFTSPTSVGLSEHAPRINAFFSQVPAPNSTMAGLALANHFYDPAREELWFELHSPIALSAPDVLVEAPIDEPGFTFGPVVVDQQLGPNAVLIRIGVEEFAFSGATPNDVPLRVTLVDGKRGVDLGFIQIGSEEGLGSAAWVQAAALEPTTGTGSAVFGPEGWSLLVLVAAAVAAGLILNVMPCVLPVLSLKVMAFVGASDQSRAEIRSSFLATAVGILVSFWILAGLIVVLQSLGTSVGWGFQFQSPWFVSFMVALMVVFAANLFGWFDVPAIPGLVAVGAGRKGPAADFLTGMLATLLATPCSAPLLAPVIGVAFAGESLTIFGLFTLIGVGMALPYWLVVLVPGIARVMPRPGPWMLLVKGALGAMLLGFALFLIWVVMAQLGIWVAALTLVTSVLILGFLYFCRHRTARVWPVLAGFTLLAAVPATSALVLPNIPPPWQGSSVAQDAIDWQPFDQSKIQSLVGDGKTVFVDVTAAWCVNCRFNKVIALDPAPVRAAFQANNIVAMQADWTNHDPAIGAYLAQFGRAGIPFNVVYSPSYPQGEILPTALSKDIVLQALDR